ncbi:hypothetical protein WDZ92_34730 [Nostoc sp. NIES-2111]
MQDVFIGASLLAALGFLLMAVLFLPSRTRGFAKNGMFYSFALFLFGFGGFVVLGPKPGTRAGTGGTRVAAAGEPSGYEIHIPSDPKARFWVLGVEKRPGGMRAVVTRREGSSGVTYSKRLVDCDRQEVKYLASADDYAGLAVERPDPRMAPLVPQSIAWYVTQQACAVPASGS